MSSCSMLYLHQSGSFISDWWQPQTSRSRSIYKMYICKTQIDIQSLSDDQSSNPCPFHTSQTSVRTSDLCPFFKFSNWRPLTSLAYTLNYVTPVRSGFWSKDSDKTRFQMEDSWWQKRKKKWAKGPNFYRESKQSVQIFHTLQ